MLDSVTIARLFLGQTRQHEMIQAKHCLSLGLIDYFCSAQIRSDQLATSSGNSMACRALSNSVEAVSVRCDAGGKARRSTSAQ